MRYTLKSGVLYESNSVNILAKIKSSVIGSEKKIYSAVDKLMLKASIHYLNKSTTNNSDISNREYLLIDCENVIVCTAYPQYAEDEDPTVMGWPICRLPRVNHASINLNEEKYVLTMQNNQNYVLTDINNFEILRVMHNGIGGGWTLDDSYGFSHEILCGIFIFCRYIEQENEFLIV